MICSSFFSMSSPNFLICSLSKSQSTPFFFLNLILFESVTLSGMFSSDFMFSNFISGKSESFSSDSSLYCLALVASGRSSSDEYGSSFIFTPASQSISSDSSFFPQNLTCFGLKYFFFDADCFAFNSLFVFLSLLFPFSTACVSLPFFGESANLK